MINYIDCIVKDHLIHNTQLKNDDVNEKLSLLEFYTSPKLDVSTTIKKNTNPNSFT